MISLILRLIIPTNQNTAATMTLDEIWCISRGKETQKDLPESNYLNKGYPWFTWKMTTSKQKSSTMVAIKLQACYQHLAKHHRNTLKHNVFGWSSKVQSIHKHEAKQTICIYTRGHMYSLHIARYRVSSEAEIKSEIFSNYDRHRVGMDTTDV